MAPKIDGNTPLLEDSKMRELGFTDNREGYWYICKPVGYTSGKRPLCSETLSFTISKENGDYSEIILDEFFGQPAYYGRMVEPHRSNIHDRVEEIIGELNSAGLKLAVDHRLYCYGE